MALYIAVCSLAALALVEDDPDIRQVSVLAVIWGTTVGLAVAHWFAYRLSARLVASGELRPHDARVGAAQLAGACAVGGLATAPIIALPGANELDVARLVLAGFIAWVGYLVARSGGATTLKAAVYAVIVLVLAGSIALLKNVLVPGGH